jgi:hypothetical protein
MEADPQDRIEAPQTARSDRGTRRNTRIPPAAAREPCPPGVDDDQAVPVAKLIRSLDDYQDAVVRIGPLMVVKAGDRMRAHCFSPEEFAHLRRDPGIQDCAPDLIELIDKLAPLPPWPDADPPRGKHRRA